MARSADRPVVVVRRTALDGSVEDGLSDPAPDASRLTPRRLRPRAVLAIALKDATAELRRRTPSSRPLLRGHRPRAGLLRDRPLRARRRTTGRRSRRRSSGSSCSSRQPPGCRAPSRARKRPAPRSRCARRSPPRRVARRQGAVQLRPLPGDRRRDRARVRRPARAGAGSAAGLAATVLVGRLRARGRLDVPLGAVGAGRSSGTSSSCSSRSRSLSPLLLTAIRQRSPRRGETSRGLPCASSSHTMGPRRAGRICSRRRRGRTERERVAMKVLKLLLLPYMAAVVAAAFLWPEPAKGFIGQSSRIVFFHVPCAWTSTLAFLVAAAYSLAYLVRRNPWHDEVAPPRCKIGLLFGVLTLITGLALREHHVGHRGGTGTRASRPISCSCSSTPRTSSCARRWTTRSAERASPPRTPSSPRS